MTPKMLLKFSDERIHAQSRGDRATVFQPDNRRPNGFSLVEILVVISIVTILASLAGATLFGLNKAGRMNQAIGGISTLLDQARTYAMAHNTYVWVGFAPNSATQTLTVGTVAGTTGEKTDLNSAATYSPVSKLQIYNNFSLKEITGISGMTANADDISTSQVGSFLQNGGGGEVSFTSILQFGPQGEATLNKTSGSSHWIQVGLQPVQGSNMTDPNVAVFQIGTLTGQVVVFRP